MPINPYALYANGTVIYLIRDVWFTWTETGKLCSRVLSMGTMGVIEKQINYRIESWEVYSVRFNLHVGLVYSDCFTTDPMDIARIALTL